MLMAVNLPLQQTAAQQQHETSPLSTTEEFTKHTQSLVQQLQQCEATMQQTLAPQLQSAEQRMQRLTNERIVQLQGALDTRYSHPAQACSIVTEEVDAIKQYRSVVHETHTFLAGQHAYKQ